MGGKKIRNYVEPHCHIKSFDAASTPEKFADRETELGTGYITCTDHGSLEGIREIYDLAKSPKYNLKFIPGLESYIRWDDDPILLEAGAEKDEQGTLKDWAKYFHQTIHFQDQKAFEAGSRILSKAFDKAEKHGSEHKPIFDWNDVQELGSYNITGTSGCLIGIVSRHLLAQNNPYVAEAFYKRARSYFKPGNFYVELFPHVCEQEWKSSVYVIYEDGDIQEFKEKNKLATDHSKVNKNSGGIHAVDLAREFREDPHRAKIKHGSINARMINRKWVELPKREIKTVYHQEGFLKNECTPYAPNGDVQLGANKFLLKMSEKYNDPVLISGDSHFAYPKEYMAQTIKLTANGQNGWRFAQSHHRQDSEEAYTYFKHQMGINEITFEKWVDNGYEWASKFDNFKLDNPIQLPSNFYPSDTEAHLKTLINTHGRMKWDDPVKVARLNQEIELFKRNGVMDFLPYFFLCEDAIEEHNKAGVLVGPGRGSVGGVYMAYLMGITHLDPLRWELSLDRFMTDDRIKLGKMPDVDMDFPNDKIFLNWLDLRFGACAAQISTNVKMRLKQTVKDVFRAKRGKVPPEIEQLVKRLPVPAQGIEDDDFIFGFTDDDGNPVIGAIETDAALKELVAKYPEEWEEISMMLGLVRQKGRHASGFVISSKPIHEFIPTMIIKDTRCTQYTPASVEASGLLKFDFLKVSKYDDLGKAVKLIQKTVLGKELTEPMIINGEKVPAHYIVPHKGDFHFVYELPKDYAVYNEIVEGRVESVFQLDSSSVLVWLTHFNTKIGEENGIPIKAINSIDGLAAFTALDRPGPLDYFVEDDHGKSHNMLVEYANRAKNEPAVGRVKELDELLPETFGILVYQEQLTKVFRVLGGSTGVEAENFRIHVGKKQVKKVMGDKAIFMKGAVEKLGEEKANQIWEMLLTFARYGFCKAHAYEYMVTAYACAFLKFYYPLEWWTAVLQNADRDKIQDKFWKHCSKFVNIPDVTKSSANFEIVDGKIQAPLWLLNGVGDKASEQIAKYAPYKDIRDFCEKIKHHKETNSEIKIQLKPDGSKVQVKRLGCSAINKKVVSCLLITGSMDTLFPTEQIVVVDGVEHKVGLSFEEKLEMYEKTLAEVSGVKYKGVQNKMVNLDDLVKFQYRKKIMPFYVEDLRDLTHLAKNVQNKDLFQKREGVSVYVRPSKDDNIPERVFPLYNGRDIWYFDQPELPVKKEETYAAVGYIASQTFFQYAGGQACKMILDIEGFQFEKVIWPKNGKLGTYYTQPLEGSVVLMFFSRRPNRNSLDLVSVIVIQEALKPTIEKEDEDNVNSD